MCLVTSLPCMLKRWIIKIQQNPKPGMDSCQGLGKTSTKVQSCQSTVINSWSVHSRVTQLQIHDPNQAMRALLLNTITVRWQYLWEIYCISNHWLTTRSGLWRLGSTYPLPRRGIRSVLLSFLVSVVRSQAWITSYSVVFKSSGTMIILWKGSCSHTELRSVFSDS